MRAFSKISQDWWDYTTLDRDILDAAARITLDTLKSYERPGFKINLYNTFQEFYCAEALEYIRCWMKATADNPCGICGPIGPTGRSPFEVLYTTFLFDLATSLLDTSVTVDIKSYNVHLAPL